MHSTAAGPLFWITSVLGIHSLLLSFSACFTDKSQNADLEWNRFTSKPITLAPLPWEKTREPFPWEITRESFPWEKTREPFPWEKTREPFPWEKTQRPFPWDEKDKFTAPPINFKDNYDGYKSSETAIKLIIFIPPLATLCLYLICKYCIFNHLSSNTSNPVATLHVPPTLHHATTPDNNRERTGIHNISHENNTEPTRLLAIHLTANRVGRFSTADSRRNNPTTLSSEKPPDYASVIMSDLSDSTPKFPTVMPESKTESPPPYYEYKNLSKY